MMIASFLVLGLVCIYIFFNSFKELLKVKKCTVEVHGHVTKNSGMDADHGANNFGVEYFYDGNEYASGIDLKKHKIDNNESITLHINPNKPMDYVFCKSETYKDLVHTCVFCLLIFVFDLILIIYHFLKL